MKEKCLSRPSRTYICQSSISTGTLMIVLFATCLISKSTAGQEVSIPDAALNQAIHDALRKPGGPITSDDLLGLQELNADSNGIQSLEGLGAARNLTKLSLRDNKLTSLVLESTLDHLEA